VSNVISLKNKSKEKIFADISFSIHNLIAALKVAIRNLENKPFNVNLVVKVKEVNETILSPALEEVAKIQKNVRRLKRLNIDNDKLDDILLLINNLSIDISLAKKGLKEITLRSNAQVLVQIILKNNLLPALVKPKKIWDKLREARGDYDFLDPRWQKSEE